MKKILLLILIVAAVLVFHAAKNPEQATRNPAKILEDVSRMVVERAQAAEVCLDSLDIVNNVADRATFAKYFYYLSAGLPTGTTFCNNTSGFKGLVPLVNDMTTGIGVALGAKGKTTCASIPTTGSDEIVDGATTYTLTYGTGSKVIPSFFASNPGTTLEKRVTIAKNGTNIIILEATCSDASTIVSGFLRAYFADDGRNIEFYFQRDTATSNGNLTMATTLGTEKQAIQFAVTSGTTFTLHHIITDTGSPAKGYYIGLTGAANGVVNLGLKFAASVADTNGLATGNTYENCLNISTVATASGCTAFANATALTVGSTATGMTVNAVSGITSSTLTSL